MILFFSFIISVFLNFIIFFLFRADCLRSSCTRTAGGQKPLFPLKKPSGSIFAAPVQNAEQQKRHQQVPDKAVYHPMAHLQDQETEKEPDLPPVPEKKGLIRRTVSRFRTGRWGEWKELITEMDDGNR